MAVSYIHMTSILSIFKFKIYVGFLRLVNTPHGTDTEYQKVLTWKTLNANESIQSEVNIHKQTQTQGFFVGLWLTKHALHKYAKRTLMLSQCITSVLLNNSCIALAVTRLNTQVWDRVAR